MHQPHIIQALPEGAGGLYYQASETSFVNILHITYYVYIYYGLYYTLFNFQQQIFNHALYRVQSLNNDVSTTLNSNSPLHSSNSPTTPTIAPAISSPLPTPQSVKMQNSVETYRIMSVPPQTSCVCMSAVYNSPPWCLAEAPRPASLASSACPIRSQYEYRSLEPLTTSLEGDRKGNCTPSQSTIPSLFFWQWSILNTCAGVLASLGRVYHCGSPSGRKCTNKLLIWKWYVMCVRESTRSLVVRQKVTRTYFAYEAPFRCFMRPWRQRADYKYTNRPYRVHSSCVPVPA